MVNRHFRCTSTPSLCCLLSASCFLLFSTSARVPCNETIECKAVGRGGRVCLDDGYCSNPFHNGGCLANMKDVDLYKSTINHSYFRVCSSSDSSQAESLGYCVQPNQHWNYTEIRLMGNNWESIFFETWIVQILLSEILGVPTSVETGYADKVIDFYDIQSRFDYGKGYDWDALRLASKVRDCRNVQQPVNVSEYKSCAHASLEVWEGQTENMQILQDELVAEKPSALGLLGYGGWYIPLFTAVSDPTLLTHFGMRGEENRRKLADAFLRPTKWIDYCTEISPNNCTVPDGVAQRPPKEDEQERMFLDGSYTGYFRKTEENDCDKHPTNCTGNFVDYPCGWSSFFQQQVYHLNIALQSSGDEPYSRGYTWPQMVDIWHAANATRNNVMMLYWNTDALVQKFAGTDAEFQKVTLPLPTQECYDNRVSSLDRCQPDVSKRIGSPLGTCDDKAQTLLKVVTQNLYDICNDPDFPEALYSPAYDAIQNFEITTLELGVLFDKWTKTGDPREAACEWVVENFDLMKTFIPRTYPRAIKQGVDNSNEPLFYTAVILGAIVLVFLCFVSATVYKQRNRRIIVMAQIDFLFIVLSGLTLVQMGAFSLAIPPSNVTCILTTWLVNLGYTLNLVPLIVKIAAINRLMSAALMMKRVEIKRSSLFVDVAFWTVVIALFLMLWTVIDPPTLKMEYTLSSDTDKNDETVVLLYDFCRSEHSVWVMIAVIWRSILLLSGTVLAFQTRNSPVNVNESKTLAVMMYSQFSFLIWSLILLLLQGTLNVSHVAWYQSIIHSLDVAAVCCIYFVPKLCTSDATFSNACQAQGMTSFYGIGSSQRSFPSEGFQSSNRKLNDDSSAGLTFSARNGAGKRQSSTRENSIAPDEITCNPDRSVSFVTHASSEFTAEIAACSSRWKSDKDTNIASDTPRIEEVLEFVPEIPGDFDDVEPPTEGEMTKLLPHMSEFKAENGSFVCKVTFVDSDGVVKDIMLKNEDNYGDITDSSENIRQGNHSKNTDG